MSGPQYELYRYRNPDGTAKEWAYADLGNGIAEIRWGPAGRLRQRQEKPIRVAVERSREKEGKGYVWEGRAVVDSTGRAHPVPVRLPPRAETAPPRPQPPPKKVPIDVAALLGGADDGFYF